MTVGGGFNTSKNIRGKIRAFEFDLGRTKNEVSELKNQLLERSQCEMDCWEGLKEVLKESVLDDFAEAMYDAMGELVITERVNSLQSIETESNRIIAEIINASRHLNNIVT